MMQGREQDSLGGFQLEQLSYVSIFTGKSVTG